MRSARRVERLAAPALGVATFCLSCFFVVQGVSLLLSERTDVLSEERPRSRTALPASSRPGPRALATAVLARNMFDSQTGGLSFTEPVSEPAPIEPVEELVQEGSPVPCTGPLRLHASIVVAKQLERSFAMIHDGQRSRFVPVGGRIGEAELIALRPALGYLRGADGVVCELRLTLPRDQRRVTRAPKIAALRAATIRKAGSKATAKGLFSAAELDAGIKSVGAKHHRVSRELLQRGLKNPVQLVKGTRFRPFKRAGRTVGMRVYGVRKDSVLYRLGVRSGDVLRSLNGYDVASPDGMLQAYTLLRQQREFTVALLRRGRDEMLRYSVE